MELLPRELRGANFEDEICLDGIPPLENEKGATVVRRRGVGGDEEVGGGGGGGRERR